MRSTGGLGVTLTYSLLAKYQTLAGDNSALKKDIREADPIFPRSVFIRVRYAIFLEEQGKSAEAESQTNMPSTWTKTNTRLVRPDKRRQRRSLLQVSKSPDSAPPADLLPDNAVRQYLTTPIFLNVVRIARTRADKDTSARATGAKCGT